MQRFKMNIWTCCVIAALLLNDCDAGRFGGRSGGGRSGGWGGGRSSSSGRSSSGSSWFGSRKSSSSNSRSSSGQGWAGGSKTQSGAYPKQQWSGTGAKPGSNTAVGGGGFVNPNKGGSNTALGGGGFVNPNRGGSSYGSGSRGYGSHGSSASGISSGGGYSYRTPGYGTNYGTSFGGGVGRYGTGSGFSKKALGLGVGAGFLGGAALGVAGTAAMYGVYHRYNQYRYMSMMHHGGMGYNGYNQNYYNNYQNNQCIGGCPMHAHCEWGFCECNTGTYKRYGRCEFENGGNRGGRAPGFDPFITCGTTKICQNMDINLICNTNLTISGDQGKCECRQDMKWNTEGGECQLFLDVDCSSITYDTKPSPVILEAVNKTLERIAEEGNETITETPPTNDNSSLISKSPNETLANSLLTSLDPNNTSDADLKEAFCRDIDSFSWEFNTARQTQDQNNQNNQRVSGGSTVGSIVGIIFAVLILFAVCCVCGICCAFKGAKNKLSGALKSGPPEDTVVYTAPQNSQPMGEGYHPNPGFHPQPTPQHTGGALPYGIAPENPPPIPPTQPGYTNAYPPLPTDNSSPYPAYPPQPLPPMSQTPAYPPADPSYSPYPPTSSPYPPITAQYAPNPTPYPPNDAPAPYPPYGQPAYNPSAPP